MQKRPILVFSEACVTAERCADGVRKTPPLPPPPWPCCSLSGYKQQAHSCGIDNCRLKEQFTPDLLSLSPPHPAPRLPFFFSLPLSPPPPFLRPFLPFACRTSLKLSRFPFELSTGENQDNAWHRGRCFSDKITGRSSTMEGKPVFNI